MKQGHTPRGSTRAQKNLPVLKLFGGMAIAAMLSVPGTASSGVSEGIDQLAAQIVTRSTDADRTTIAISSFRHVDDTCSELSNFLVDELVLSLFNFPDNQLSIIERSQLDRIFSELELSLSGAVDANTTQELGRVHGVETLLVGTLSKIGDDLRINARLIDTESAQVYSAAAVNIPQTSTIEDLMERPAAGGCTMAPSARSGEGSEGSAAAQGLPAPNFEFSLPGIDDNFEIAMLEGRWAGQLNCESGLYDRAVRLLYPSPIGLKAQIFYRSRTGSAFQANHRTVFAYDLRKREVGNAFILNVEDWGIPMSIVARDVLYGEFVHGGSDEECSLTLGRMN